MGAGLVAHAGEVHALLGENGAGKTTLMHVASGMTAPDTGAVLVDGAPRLLKSPRDARAAGIGLVHQHFTSIAALTVAENVALFAGWDVRPRELALRVAALTERLNLPLDPGARAGTLPVALLQRLEIVKALAGDARVLLLDEPTAYWRRAKRRSCWPGHARSPSREARWYSSRISWMKRFGVRTGSPCCAGGGLYWSDA
jgi:simple sugar transport system ATP-binding protein